MKHSVLVIGSFNQNLAFGVGNFPKPGDSVVGDFRAGPGGKGFNQAVASSRAGVATLFVGAVGPDAFGDLASEFIRKTGLPARLIRKPKHSTGVTVVTIDSTGQNHTMISPGANFALRPRDIPTALFEPAQVVVCQCESDFSTITHALRTARRHGAITVLNPAPVRSGFDPALLRHTEILIPNETEFLALVKLRPAGAALLRSAPFHQAGELTAHSLPSLPAEGLHRLCRSLGVPVVIITLGPRGCFVSQPDEYKRIHAHEVEVVDTTGAGDAFVGGFAAGLVKFKHNACEAAHYASAVAALSTMQPGAASAMPGAREIARFLKKRDHA